VDEQEAAKVKVLIENSINLGFSMGIVSMRLRVMEILEPYLSQDVLQSELLTTRDVMRLIFEGLHEFDTEAEFAKMRTTLNGLENA
jgi:hypothetical protein